MAKIGNYTILEQIGEGGFGRTYKAQHLLLPSIYACLKQNINITKDDQKILEKEATLLSQISHYSLPTFRDYYCVTDGDGLESYVLAMSFVEGKNLQKSVEKHKAINPEDVAWMTQRLLNALFYLHNNGIVHGDIKPNNIIVQPQKHNALLVDFGLSSYKPNAKTKADGYTPIFVAPETTSGKPPIPESDLYGLALTMMYTLGGDPIAKTMPSHVPKSLQEFFLNMAKYNPLERPTWENGDLIARLSDVRQESFGRRSST